LIRSTAALLATALLLASCRAPVRISELPEQHTPSGLALLDLRVGDGAVPVTVGSSVTVHYSGRFTDGRPFDSSYDRGAPLHFVVGAGEVVAGWDEGLIGMRAGGERRIVIPRELALEGGLEARDAALELEVELLEVAGP